MVLKVIKKSKVKYYTPSSFHVLRAFYLRKRSAMLFAHKECCLGASSPVLHHPPVTYIVSCWGVVQIGGPLFRYYWVVPPRCGSCKFIFIHFSSWSYKKTHFLIIIYLTLWAKRVIFHYNDMKKNNHSKECCSLKNNTK